MVSLTGISGPTTIPRVAGDNVADVVEAIRAVLANHEVRLADKEQVDTTLEDLFKQSGASTADNFIEASEDIGPVKNFTVRTLPDRIMFLLELPPFVQTNDTPTPTRAIVQLFRGLEDDHSSTLDIVAETTGQVLTDIPPSDVAYRYFLMYRSSDHTKTGPVTPPEGIAFKATSTNPEAVLSTKDGGLFLETFEDANIGVSWDETTGSTPTIDYPENGIVGGKVARIAGAMWWGVAKQLIPYDPNVLYRVKVGLKRTANSTGGAAGQDFTYLGIAGVAADGVTFINVTGANSSASQHYVAASGASPTLNTYTEYTGYIKGFSGSPTSGAFPHLDAPGPLHTGIAYVRPLVLVNYNGGNGTWEVDYVRLDALQPTPPWIVRGNCAAQDSSIMKVGGSSAWDSDASSINSFTTCYLRAKFSDTTSSVMFALNSDPLTDQSYTSLDYTLYGAGGTLHIYESNSDIGAFGTYTTSDEFAIVRDLAAGTVTYFKNRVQLRQLTGLSTATRYYADTSFFTPGAALNHVDFGPGTVIPTIDTGQIEPGAATEVIQLNVGAGTVAAATFPAFVEVGAISYGVLPFDCNALMTITCDAKIASAPAGPGFQGYVAVQCLQRASGGPLSNLSSIWSQVVTQPAVAQFIVPLVAGVSPVFQAFFRAAGTSLVGIDLDYENCTLKVELIKK